MSNRIIVRLQGGLGNQMFQYAMGRAISVACDKELYLDISSYKYDTKRKYELDNYNIKYNRCGNFLTLKITKVLYEKNKNNNLGKFLQKKCGYGTEIEEYIYQDNVNYEYLDGYWQNVLYFEHILDELKKELTFKGLLNTEQKKMVAKIQNENSVAVHIRRGDYLDNQNTYYLLGLDYYNLALDYMKKNINEELHFYFFSDDIEWCKKVFSNIENSTFITNDISSDHHTDFELMRSCKHFILANSTFSWWASWLSENDSKCIVGPKDWFVDSEKNRKNKNALLSSSILL